jgi:hypothetical protein
MTGNIGGGQVLQPRANSDILKPLTKEGLVRILSVHERRTGRYPFPSRTRAAPSAGRRSLARSPLYLCAVYQPEAAAKLDV